MQNGSLHYEICCMLITYCGLLFSQNSTTFFIALDIIVWVGLWPVFLLKWENLYSRKKLSLYYCCRDRQPTFGPLRNIDIIWQIRQPFWVLNLCDTFYIGRTRKVTSSRTNFIYCKRETRHTTVSDVQFRNVHMYM